MEEEEVLVGGVYATNGAKLCVEWEKRVNHQAESGGGGGGGGEEKETSSRQTADGGC